MLGQGALLLHVSASRLGHTLASLRARSQGVRRIPELSSYVIQTSPTFLHCFISQPA